MVRGFGLLLVVGIALALLCALTLGVAAQALAGARCGRGPRRRRRLARPPGGVGAAWRGAGRDRARARGCGRAPGRSSAGGPRARWAPPSRIPGRVLAIAALRGGGRLGAADTQTQRRVRRPEARAAAARRRCATCASSSDQRRRRRGRRARRGPRPDRPGGRRLDDALPGATSCKRFATTRERGCGGADAVPGVLAARPVHDGGLGSSTAQVDALLDAVPPYFSQGVITPDRRRRDARVRHPADAARAPAATCSTTMQRELRPAAGRDARGSPACRCSPPRPTTAIASPWRRLATLLAGLLAVALVLLAALPPRAARARAAVPIALATGWSALVAVRARGSRSTRCRSRSARS